MKITTSKLTNRGIVTISLLATVCSFPLVYLAYLNEYASRMEYNPNYNGNIGGEMFIPFIVYIIIYLVLTKVNRGHKYEKI